MEHFPLVKINNFIVQKRWHPAVEETVNKLGKDHIRFLRVLDWYKLNVGGKYIKDCHSIIVFCQNFHSIEKAMNRQSGEDLASSQVEVKTRNGVTRSSLQELNEELQ